MKVSLKDASRPEGTELHVRGLGTLVNGKTIEFDKEQVAAFEARRGMTLEKAFKNNPSITVGKAEDKKGGE